REPVRHSAANGPERSEDAQGKLREPGEGFSRLFSRLPTTLGFVIVRLLLYLVELLFVVLVWRTLGRAIRAFFGATGANPSTGARNSRRNASSPPAVHGETARDPVCGMFVSTELSLRLKRDGKTLHFCSRDCLERYESDNSGSMV